MSITKNGKRIAILALMMATVLSACNRNKSAYSCICYGRANGAADSSYSYGETSKNSAYSQCAVHNNSVDTCMMIIMN